MTTRSICGLALAVLLTGCSSSPERVPAVPPSPSGPHEAPELGRPRPKLLPDEAVAGSKE